MASYPNWGSLFSWNSRQKSFKNIFLWFYLCKNIKRYGFSYYSVEGFREIGREKEVDSQRKWMNDETQICHRCFLGGGKTSSALIPFISRTPPILRPIYHMSDISLLLILNGIIYIEYEKEYLTVYIKYNFPYKTVPFRPQSSNNESTWPNRRRMTLWTSYS